MAKPSKTRQVEGDDDPKEQMKTKTHSLPEELRPSLSRTDSAYSELKRGDDGYSSQGRLHEREDEEDEEDVALQRGADRDTDDADDERRESVFTFASISSLPESAYEMDPANEKGVMHKPYTPMMIRPSFRRPESVRRMQMSSPTPSERSLRRSLLSSQRVRTPNSGKPSVKGSPRRPKWAHEKEEEEKKEYPLVLLHMTLLPIELRWSKETMEELLSGDTLESLQLLQSRLSSTILQRGILIPHPKDEYELLEERLLEALELKTERVTKCGHFRARESTSSASSEDSGVGSSVEDVDDGTSCRTCHRHLSAVSTAVGGGRKWSIKVFAANGLMRASAWTAAWSEMESVDIEIMPWIDEDVRKSLDARTLKEEVEENARQDEEMRRIATTAEEQFRVESVREAKMWEEQACRDRPEQQEDFKKPTDHKMSISKENTVDEDLHPVSRKADDLPPVYPRKDIPLSLLLRNYIFLLAQDKRNVLIFGLTLLTLFFGLRASLGPVTTSLPLPPPIYEHIDAPLPTLQHTSNPSFSSPAQPALPAFVASSAIEQVESIFERTTAATEESATSSCSAMLPSVTEDAVFASSKTVVEEETPSEASSTEIAASTSPENAGEEDTPKEAIATESPAASISSESLVEEEIPKEAIAIENVASTSPDSLEEEETAKEVIAVESVASTSPDSLGEEDIRKEAIATESVASISPDSLGEEETPKEAIATKSPAVSTSSGSVVEEETLKEAIAIESVASTSPESQVDEEKPNESPESPVEEEDEEEEEPPTIPTIPNPASIISTAEYTEQQQCLNTASPRHILLEEDAQQQQQ